MEHHLLTMYKRNEVSIQHCCKTVLELLPGKTVELDSFCIYSNELLLSASPNITRLSGEFKESWRYCNIKT